MQKIKILQNYTTTDGGFYSKGEIVEVSNNIAHGLIEQSIAVLFVEIMKPKVKIMKPQKDKMMKAESEKRENKKYRTK